MGFDCNICKDIKNYEIKLKSFNINNNLNSNKNGLHLNVAVSTEYLDPIMGEVNCEIPFSVKVIGIETTHEEFKDLNRNKKNIDLNSKKVLFGIDILYVINLFFNEEVKDKENFLNKEIKLNIRNILKPYIDETLSYASLKIGIPRLDIPTSALE